RNSAMYRALRKGYQEKGDADALARARALVESNARLTVADRDRLFGFLEGTGPGWAQDVQVLRQHDRDSRRAGFGGQKAQGHANRSGARAPYRSWRPGQVSGVGFAQDVFKCRHSSVGAAGVPRR